MALETRRLGRTELQISCLGLGAMGIISHYHKRRAQSERVVHRALELGINLIDTASSYFDSEQILGGALAGRHQQVHLATKSLLRRGKGFSRELERSFRRLRTDHISIYQLHHVQYRHELQQVLGPGGALEVLQREKRRGRVRFVGITSHHPGVLVEALETGEFDTVQFPFNPIEAQAFGPVLEQAVELDIGTLGMKPLSGGRLTSVEAALQYSASHPIACTLAGCSTVQQVERDVEALSGKLALTDEGRQALEQEISSLGDLFCRRCRYCERQCPEKIPISDVFRCHDYLVLNQTYARDEYRKLLVGQGKYQRCANCGACEAICPYELPVRQMLDTAHGELSRRRLSDLAMGLLHRTGTYDIVRKAFFRIGGARVLPEHRYLHRKDIQPRCSAPRAGAQGHKPEDGP